MVGLFPSDLQHRGLVFSAYEGKGGGKLKGRAARREGGEGRGFRVFSGSSFFLCFCFSLSRIPSWCSCTGECISHPASVVTALVVHPPRQVRRQEQNAWSVFLSRR